MWGGVGVAGIEFPLAGLWGGWQSWYCKYLIYTYSSPGFSEALLCVKSSLMAFQGTLGIHFRANVLNRLLLLSWLITSQKKIQMATVISVTSAEDTLERKARPRKCSMDLLLFTEGWSSPMAPLDPVLTFGSSWVQGPLKGTSGTYIYIYLLCTGIQSRLSE